MYATVNSIKIMKESDYYPAGAYSDPSAPYNEQPVPERIFDVHVVQILSKDDKVCTSDYTPEIDEENGHVYANTENTDWNKANRDSNYEPIDIINACKCIAQWAIDNGTSRIGKYTLEDIVDACNDWEVDETTVEEL